MKHLTETNLPSITYQTVGKFKQLADKPISHVTIQQTVVSTLTSLDEGMHVIGDIKASQGWKPSIQTLQRLLIAHGSPTPVKRKNVTLYNKAAVIDAMATIVRNSVPKNQNPKCKTLVYKDINFVWYA